MTPSLSELVHHVVEKLWLLYFLLFVRELGEHHSGTISYARHYDYRVKKAIM